MTVLIYLHDCFVTNWNVLCVSGVTIIIIFISSSSTSSSSSSYGWSTSEYHVTKGSDCDATWHVFVTLNWDVS